MNYNDFNNHHDYNKQEAENHNEQPASATNQSEPTQDTKSSKSSGIGKIFSAGIIGGLIATLIMTLLLSTNLLSADDQTSSSKPESEEPKISDEVFSSDDADISANINELAKAVVGVVNIQKQNIFDQGSQAGTGSGIIYKKENGEAYVATNQHVIEGAKEVEVVLDQNTRVQAEVIGQDQLTDLAVLKIPGEKVDTVAKLGTSKNVEVGETVIAVGNPLGLEFSNSVTKGIISGLNRSISVDTNGDRQPDWVTEVIQTDAAINPGNSGGALVNDEGEVIGINSMKIATQRVEGMGFAIPIDNAKKIIKQLEENGEVERPLIGVSIVPIRQVPQPYAQNIEIPEDVDAGLVIAQVKPNSPAAEAGLKQYDVITKIDGEEINNYLDLRTYLYNEVSVGDQVKLTYYRNGEAKTAELTLDEVK